MGKITQIQLSSFFFFIIIISCNNRVVPEIYDFFAKVAYIFVVYLLDMFLRDIGIQNIVTFLMNIGTYLLGTNSPVFKYCSTGG